MSARLDDAGVIPGFELDRHLAGCALCRGWLADVEAVSRRLRVTEAEPGVDLTGSVLAAIGPVLVLRALRVARRERLARNGLAVAGAMLLILVGVALIGAARYVPASAHLTSTTGFWAAVLGAGFVAVALSPSRSTMAFPFLATSASFLLVASVFDVAGRHVHLVHEVPTTVAIAGMTGVLALAWTRRGGELF